MNHLVNVYFKKSDDKNLDGRTNGSIITMNSMGVTTKDIDGGHYLIIRVCNSNSGIERDRFILELPKELLQDIQHTFGQLKLVWNGTVVFKILIWLCEHGYNSETLCYPDHIPVEKYIIQNIIRTGFFYYDNFLHTIKRKKKNDEEFSYQGKTYTIS